MTKLTRSRARCPHCYISIFSNYGTARDLVRFVRSGTLDAYPEWLKPDIHIYASSKQPWVVIPEGVRTEERFYDIKTLWSKEALDRWEKIQEKVKERAREREDREAIERMANKMDELTVEEEGNTSKKRTE